MDHVTADGPPTQADRYLVWRLLCFAQAKASNASLPVAALVDQFYSRLEARGGKRWDSTASLIQLLLKD